MWPNDAIIELPREGANAPGYFGPPLHSHWVALGPEGTASGTATTTAPSGGSGSQLRGSTRRGGCCRSFTLTARRAAEKLHPLNAAATAGDALAELSHQIRGAARVAWLACRASPWVPAVSLSLALAVAALGLAGVFASAGAADARRRHAITQAMAALLCASGAALGAVLFGMLVHRQGQAAVLDELRAANMAFVDEKRRGDLLLSRQMQLIGLLVGQGRLRDQGAADALAAAARAAGLAGQFDAEPVAAMTAHERVEQMRRAVHETAAAAGAPPARGGAPGGAAAGGAIAAADADAPRLQHLLGEGAFGRVWRAIWRGTPVAVKVIVLPARMASAAKRERMAIMEAAISSALSHPNVVQTYTYSIRPIQQPAPAPPPVNAPAPVDSTAAAAADGGGVDMFSLPRAAGRFGAGGRPAAALSDDGPPAAASSPSSGDNAGGALPPLLPPLPPPAPDFELSLVLELCELGSLRETLDAGAFCLPGGGGVNQHAVLDTAIDVARAMVHLHCQSVVHSDLKARNVLLKADGRSGRGCIAKVADFGLALHMASAETHVSEFQGTPTHMSPELLLARRCGKPADVYAFGITMWELWTAKYAYASVPAALLGHRVSVEGLRPAFPPSTPPDYAALAAACWAPRAADRPSFSEVLARLLAMRRALGGRTPRLRAFRTLSSGGYLLSTQHALATAAVAAAAATGAHAGGGGAAGAGVAGDALEISEYLRDLDPAPRAGQRNAAAAAAAPPSDAAADLLPVSQHQGVSGFTVSLFGRHHRRAAAAAAAATPMPPHEPAAMDDDGPAPQPGDAVSPAALPFTSFRISGGSSGGALQAAARMEAPPGRLLLVPIDPLPPSPPPGTGAATAADGDEGEGDEAGAPLQRRDCV